MVLALGQPQRCFPHASPSINVSWNPDILEGRFTAVWNAVGQVKNQIEEVNQKLTKLDMYVCNKKVKFGSVVIAI